MERNHQIIIASGMAIAGIIGYAIYTDLSRLFPKKDDKGSKD